MQLFVLLTLTSTLLAAESLQLPLLSETPPTTNPSIRSSRRGFLATAAAFGGVTLLPQPSSAVVPITPKEIDAGVGLARWKRPKPPARKISRQDLAQDFAIMLIRSSYIETVQLEIGPMNQLERDMYLVRTAEYEPYRNLVEAVKQGDLTDPYYFDYMSLVQYLTINRALKNPQTEYDQQEPIMEDNGLQSSRFNAVHIKRSLPDDMLVSTHDERVGTAILGYLNDIFGNTSIAIPKFNSEDKPSHAQVLQALKQLINLFLVNGFAWEGKAELVKSNNKSGTFLLTLSNPATLWSAQCLEKANFPLRNDFLLKTAKQLVTSMGYTVTSSAVKIDGNKELSYLIIQ